MNEIKVCTHKQVDRVLSNIQKDITDLRNDKNIYNDKRMNFVRFPRINSKYKDIYGDRTVLSEFEKGKYFGKLAGLKYARKIIHEYRTNLDTYVNKFQDRDLNNIMKSEDVSFSITDTTKSNVDNIPKITRLAKIKRIKENRFKNHNKYHKKGS